MLNPLRTPGGNQNLRTPSLFSGRGLIILGLVLLTHQGLAETATTEDVTEVVVAEPPGEGLPTQAFIPLTPEDSYSQMISRGIAAFEAEDYEQALVYLDEAFAVSPNSPFILNLRGAVYTKLKDYTAARKNFEAAISADAGFFPARFNLGELLFLEGQYEEALAYFELLNASYPRNELIHFKLIVLFAMTDRREDAARTLQRLRFPGETPSWYYSHAAFRALEGDKRDSRRYLRAAREIFPEEQRALYEESMEESNLLR
jgi:tetratricopeptide (TPR) repeat protein